MKVIKEKKIKQSFKYIDLKKKLLLLSGIKVNSSILCLKFINCLLISLHYFMLMLPPFLSNSKFVSIYFFCSSFYSIFCVTFITIQINI